MRALGVKNAKPNKYKRMIERPKAKAVDNITTAGISKFTVVETVTQERFGK